MGIDACIFVKTTDGEEPGLCDQLPNGFSVLNAETLSAPEGATHEINQSCRYYSKDYERGPWPIIAAALMTLKAAPNVESVWYFGDSRDGSAPITNDEINEISAHYMTNGDRSYRNRQKVIFQKHTNAIPKSQN